MLARLEQRAHEPSRGHLHERDQARGREHVRKRIGGGQLERRGTVARLHLEARLEGIADLHAAFVRGRTAGRASLLRRAPIAPLAAACTMRRNFGHSMWLGALQLTACFKPSRIAVSCLIVSSSSFAFAASFCRSIRSRPSGENIAAISSSEKPAALP